MAARFATVTEEEIRQMNEEYFYLDERRIFLYYLFIYFYPPFG